MKVDNGGGSGGTPATLELAQGRLGVVDLLHDKLGELLANQEGKKKRWRVLSFTGGDDGTAAAEKQRRRRCVQAMLWRVSGSIAGAKGRCGSSS
jgi:hypothetical protein